MLNIKQFKRIEAVGLKIIASSPPMKIYQAVQTLLVGNRQADILE
jgi:hypothetical protein